MVNNGVLPFYSDVLMFSGKIMEKTLPMVSLVYEMRGIWNNFRSGEADSRSVSLGHHAFRLYQHLSMGITDVKKVNIQLAIRHSFSKESNNKGVQYFFMDTKVNYSNTSKGMDLSFSATNLFNVITNTRYSLTPYQLTIDQYHIRGRIGGASIKLLFLISSC